MNIDKLIKEIQLFGGFTYQLKFGFVNHSKGYYVSIKEYERVLEDGEDWASAIQDYVQTHKEVLEQKGKYFGCWRDGVTGKVYLDVSLLVHDREEAIQKARSEKQIAIWGNAERRSISV